MKVTFETGNLKSERTHDVWKLVRFGCGRKRPRAAAVQDAGALAGRPWRANAWGLRLGIAAWAGAPTAGRPRQSLGNQGPLSFVKLRKALEFLESIGLRVRAALAGAPGGTDQSIWKQ